ncbi:putative GMC oxidoreductase [Daldinia loculata]|uniref:putative GMC oxidoreductase n=1 Tax=Daldinia loculata TaxID=103429 RepID=UPI0020C1CBC0|nr:putative GMC oxidoreductase [Daldinia loculata]KAI1646446.1 putative GMC oxidoreductase [Daldinia loculata]
MTESTAVDYIIVGGGLSGCALASRLRRSLPNSSILVLEAGQDPDPEHDVVSTFGGFALQGGGDIRWSYAGLLPYFRRTESFYDTSASAKKHGFDGPLKITPTKASHAARKCPLRDPVERAWKEVGLKRNLDPFANRLAGLGDFYETWEDGKRRPSHLAYPLKGVDVRTSTTVSQILFEGDGTPKAIGVKLENGQTVRVRKEIILSAGTLQTPRLLLRSGIGEPSVFSENNIPLVQALPSVGQQYFDHFALFQWFKIKDPSRGLVLGHPNLSNPAFVADMSGDFSANEGLPRDILEKALDEDGIVGAEREALLQPGRVFVETLIFYHALAPGFSSDGSVLCTSTMLTLPSSRGCVSLSKDIDSPTPHIEPNYFTTALDHASLIHGVRRLLNVMLGTEDLEDYIESELPPPGLNPLTLESSDSKSEDRIRAVGVAHFHAMGSCAMGKVVDGDLRVKGVQSLRICDASVFPSPVGGYPMASLYGVVKQAADIIAAGA